MTARAPYSPVRRAGDFIVLSGQIGVRDGTLVPGGFLAELDQVLANIDALLQSEGLSRDDVVKATVFLADIEDWPALNDPYTAFFGDLLPARTAFQAAALPLGARVEIEAWAYRPATA